MNLHNDTQTNITRTMSNEDELMELVPQGSLQPQALDADSNSTWPVYRLLRTPRHVLELCQRGKITPRLILIDNETLISVPRGYTAPNVDPSNQVVIIYVSWSYLKPIVGIEFLIPLDTIDSTDCKIVAPSKEAAFETVMMLWDLPAEDLFEFKISSGGSLSSTELFHWFRLNYSAAPMSFHLMYDSDEEDFLSVSRRDDRYNLFYRGKQIETYLQGIADMPNILTLSMKELTAKLTLWLCRHRLLRLSLLSQRRIFGEKISVQ